MINYLEMKLLGIIQGITEFFPISSSGHLLISRSIFGMETKLSDSFIESDTPFKALKLFSLLDKLIFPNPQIWHVRC